MCFTAFGGCFRLPLPLLLPLCSADILRGPAGRGIGRAIALLCADEGARVAILALTKTELDAVAVEAKQKLGSDMVVVTADVTLVPQRPLFV